MLEVGRSNEQRWSCSGNPRDGPGRRPFNPSDPPEEGKILMRLRRGLVPPALALFAAIALAGPVSAATHGVQATDNHGVSGFRFSPSTITIAVGDAVTWTNSGTVPHTATGSGFDSGNLNVGQSFSQSFNSVGTFSYHCQYHGSLGMVGTVVVKSASTPPPSGGGGSSPPPPLPNTGSSASTLPFLVLGTVLVLGGTAALAALRRRRA
jgi:LPXTG-motif cell wall-anchored protein